jgi:hypothetical protein
MATCVGPPDMIVMGSMGVMINYLPAARLGDPTVHGGVIVLGSFTCIIGEIGTPSPGAGGLGGVVGGMVASGATPLQTNPSVYSKAGSASDSANASPSPSASTPQEKLEIAKAFYNQTGWSEEKISNHLRGIDFNHPVEIAILHPGDVVKQWVDPKAGAGNYFDADAQPEELGLYPASAVPRELKTFVVSKETKVLKSTAASIRIDWLKGVPPVVVKGGAQQCFALPKDNSNFVPGGPKR